MSIRSTPASRPAWRSEVVLLAGFAALVVLAIVLPPIRQDPDYHRFADARAWLGVPSAANVLSNLAFVAVGIFGAFELRTARARSTDATAIGLWCVAVGFVLTGLGSAWYHANPNDLTLVWDRLPMTLVLSGIIAAAIAARVGEKPGRFALAALIAGGVASVMVWHANDNLTPYALFQFGGIAILLALLLATNGDHDPFPWAWIVGWYALAKGAEMGDRTVWDVSGGIVAGHTIKHLAAAAAGAAMFYSLRKI